MSSLPSPSAATRPEPSPLTAPAPAPVATPLSIRINNKPDTVPDGSLLPTPPLSGLPTPAVERTAPLDTVAAASPLEACAFGHDMRSQHFDFAAGHLPMNHGSYGVSPRHVVQRLAALHTESNQRPDAFFRATLPRLQCESRALVAELLDCAVQDVVLSANASTATDAVLRNIEWVEGDVLLYYEGCYPALEKAVLYLMERTPLKAERLAMAWPVSDQVVLETVEAAMRRINSVAGQRVRMLICDTVLSLPAVRAPWEQLCALARAHGAWTLVDGAHGIGQLDISLRRAQPDFFVSNLHKWLHVPRGCAALYVAPELQPLMRSSLPTSHGFVPRAELVSARINNPLPGKSAGAFADLFAWTATMDYTPFLCVRAALEWRARVCGGEAAVREYCVQLARAGAAKAAELLGTEVMGARLEAEAEASGEVYRGRQCAMNMVRLPIEVADGEKEREPGIAYVEPAHAAQLSAYLYLASIAHQDTYVQNIRHRDVFWWRVSAQVYLEVQDFADAAHRVKELCARVKDGSWLVEYEKLMEAM